MKSGQEKKSKRLQLNLTTLRNLNPIALENDALRQVVGGLRAGGPGPCSCAVHCPTAGLCPSVGASCD